MIYYDIDGFHAKQNENETRYPMTEEEVQTLFEDMNSRDQSHDIWRFIPDKDGKPTIIELEVDYVSIYRKRRDRECFPIINRGNAWYNSLTQTQKDEIQVWYQEWLNITETLVEPIKPSWLK